MKRAKTTNERNKMLTEEQREARKAGIGGSDVAALLGISPWKTPYKLWLEKTGRIIEDDISYANHIKFGNYFEPSVGSWFSAESGKKLKPKKDEMLVHSTIPYLFANVDFEIDGENAILECKTSLGDNGWGNGTNEIPMYYLTQIAHYCLVGNFDKAYIAVVFASKREMRYYIYDKNLELETKLLAKEKEFWNYVRQDVAPPPCNESDLMLLYKETKATPIVANNEIEEKAYTIKNINAQIKLLEEQKNKAKTDVCLYMKDFDTLLSTNGSPLATWRFTKEKSQRRFLIKEDK